MSSKRKPIKASVRFEVFKRDSFKCQYCGAASPDVVLQVDHIHPVSKGGDNEVMNLITACRDCNGGKSDKTLSDNSVIERQRAQLEELNERREQLEMMLQWRQELRSMDDDMITAVVDEISLYLPDNMCVNDSGRDSIRRWLHKYSFLEVMEAAPISADRHNPRESDPGSVGAFFAGIPKTCAFYRLPDDERKVFYARGILRNRLTYMNENMVIQLIRNAIADGGDIEEIIELAKTVTSWTQFKNALEGNHE